METLISYKNSYSDFKQSYQVQLEHAKGQLKYGIRYGENYHLPLDEKKVVFYLSNNDQRMECLLKVMEAFVIFNLDQEYKAHEVLLTLAVMGDIMAFAWSCCWRAKAPSARSSPSP